MMKGINLNILLLTALGFILISQCGAHKQMSMSMIKKQSKIKSTDTFIHEMIAPRQPEGQSLKPNEKSIFKGTEPGFNNQAVALMANDIATPDLCDPRLMTVVIPPDPDPDVIYWPSCTKLEQCGGCCGHELLQCEPTSTETVIVQVMKQKVSDSSTGRLDYSGNVEVPLTRHLACDCQCKIKAEDCNPSIQDYDSESCLCRCKNAGDATTCQLPKRWDEKHCRCMCSNLINCLDDEVFDFNTCSCVPKPTGLQAPDQVQAEGYSLPNPCHSHQCRAGMKATRVGNACECRRVRRSYPERS